MSVQYKESGTWKDISSGSNNAVDTVENGNMNPVTSNAVYDAVTPITTVTSGTVANIGSWTKYGKVVHFVLTTTSTYLPDGGTFTLPFKPAITDSFPTWWGATFFGYLDLNTNGTALKQGGTNANLYSSFTYITND